MQLLNSISNNRIINKHGLKVAWAFALLFVLITLLDAGASLYKQRKIKTDNYSAQALPQVQKDNQPNYRTSDILGANLFGDPTPKPVARKAPKTTLNLTLQGILWASDGSMARAIIRSGKKNSNLYSIGESIEGAGASVKEIRNGEVILNRNGAAESLPLIKKTSSGNRQLITYASSGNDPYSEAAIAAARTEKSISPPSIKRSSPRPRSKNGEPRKIRKPNSSGLDKALKKMGEL
ncbi:MAG: type II secretion system protein C [Cryomorphaceae bacterium]|jgi:type II secretion system protein C